MTKRQRYIALSTIVIALLFLIADQFHLFESNTKPANTSSIQTTNDAKEIAQLSNPTTVINYLKSNKSLPDYYIKKNDARNKGWDAAKGNLCDVLPGKVIGGDIFGNREGKLPNQAGRVWYEADVNYDCGRRDADRIVFSNDGLIYITKDHYQTFQLQ